MSLEKRASLAVGLLFLDVVIFFIPIMAILMGYIILSRPLWFQKWVGDLYSV